MPNLVVSLPRLLTFAAAGATSLAAQCNNPWIAGTAPFDEEVHATTMWDPDGGEPLPARLVAGGSCGQLGGGVPSRIASYDPASQAWVPVGTGIGWVRAVGQSVAALATLANGNHPAVGRCDVPRDGFRPADDRDRAGADECDLHPAGRHRDGRAAAHRRHVLTRVVMMR